MEWTRTTFTPHPEGVFKAQFVSWEEDNGGQYGQQVKLTFDTEEMMEDGRPFRISVWTKPSLHEKGRVAKLLKAYGEDAEEIDVETFDLDEYIGRKCQVIIEHYRGQDGSTKAKIANFLPAKKGKPEAAPPQAAPPEERKTSSARVPVRETSVAADPRWDEE